MEKKNVVIYVAGQRFSIATADTEEYVIGIGDKVDVMIRGISKDNPRLNRDSCAILTALNFCDDETKLRQMMEVLREQVKDYINTNDALRTENCKLKEELAALKAAAEKAPAKEVKAPAKEPETKTAPKEVKKEATATPIPTKSESVVATAAAPQRQVAFVGKDFKSNKDKNNKQKNNKSFAPAPVVASTQINNDADETQAEDVSTYHQFSIFDDLP